MSRKSVITDPSPPIHLGLDHQVVEAARWFHYAVRRSTLALFLAVISFVAWLAARLWLEPEESVLDVAMNILVVGFMVGANTYYAGVYARREVACRWMCSVRQATFAPPLPRDMSLASWAAAVVRAADADLVAPKPQSNAPAAGADRIARAKPIASSGNKPMDIAQYEPPPGTEPYTHWGYMPSRAAMTACRKELAKEGFGLTAYDSAKRKHPQKDWVLCVWDAVPAGSAVSSYSPIVAIIERHGGQYGGRDAGWFDLATGLYILRPRDAGSSSS